jgi:hypothetical protein
MGGFVNGVVLFCKEIGLNRRKPYQATPSSISRRVIFIRVSASNSKPLQ